MTTETKHDLRRMAHSISPMELTFTSWANCIPDVLHALGLASAFGLFIVVLSKFVNRKINLTK